MIFQKVRPVKSPSKGTGGSAGIDFYIPEDFQDYILHPGKSILIPSGIKSKFEQHLALIAFNKSGVVTKKSIITGAQVVDSDYQGEIHIHLMNVGEHAVTLKAGEKIVQFLPIHIGHADEIQITTDEIHTQKTERAEGGFGSTGNA